MYGDAGQNTAEDLGYGDVNSQEPEPSQPLKEIVVDRSRDWISLSTTKRRAEVYVEEGRAMSMTEAIEYAMLES